MRYLATFLAAVITAAATADDPVDDDKPTAAEIREAKIYDAIADMIIRRNDLLQRFAVVLYGEVAALDEGGSDQHGQIHPAVMVRAACKKRKLDLKTQYIVRAEHGGLEDGRLEIQIGDDLFGGSPIGGQYAKRGTEHYTLFDNGQDAGGHDPFDDYLLFAGALRTAGDFGSIERDVLGRYKLIDSQQIGHQLTARFEQRFRNGTIWKVEIELDESKGMVPNRTTVKVDTGTKYKAPPLETRIDWKRHGKRGTWLPDRIRFVEHSFGGLKADGSPSVMSEEFALKCYWLVGDEFSDTMIDRIIAGKHDSGLTDEATELIRQTPTRHTDYLSPLLDHFEIPHSIHIGNNTVRAEHRPPDGLYDDND